MISKIQEIFEAYQIMVDPTLEQSRIAADRLRVCDSCENKKLQANLINICGLCGCVLAAKVFTPKKDSCPAKKWSE